MIENISKKERLIRALIATIMGLIGFIELVLGFRNISIIFFVFGIILGLTSLFAFCPFYLIFKKAK